MLWDVLSEAFRWDSFEPVLRGGPKLVPVEARE